MTKIFLASFVLSSLAWSQQGGVSGPTSGYVFDAAARELRPMRGVAGAAYLGAALISDADAASASSDGSLAAVSRSGAVEVVRGLDSVEPVPLALAQESGDVRFAWSGHDLAAVFPSGRKALVWRSVDKKTEVTASFDLSSVEGEIIAVLFDGERLLLAAKGGLYLAKEGSVNRILDLDDPSAMTASGGDLFVADRTRGQILRVRDYAGLPAVELFAEVDSPAGLQVVRRSLLVASAGTRTVDTFDIASKTRAASIELDFSPTRMEALGSRALTLLNTGSAAEPLYVLDAKDSLQVYFVPAGREQ